MKVRPLLLAIVGGALLAGLFCIGWARSGKLAHASPPPMAEEALERRYPAGPVTITDIGRSRVGEWLTALKRAETTPRDTPGAGTLYELRAPAFHGGALVWDHGVVHVEMFPAELRMTVAPNRLDYRRERYRGR